MRQKTNRARFTLLFLLLCMISGCAGCLTVVDPPQLSLEEPSDLDTPGGDPSEWGSTDPNMEYPRQIPVTEDVPGGSPSDWGPVTDPNTETSSSRPPDDTADGVFNWKSIAPRIGFTYDILGDGRRTRICPSTAHQAGIGDVTFQGKDTASGTIFDVGIKNNIGESLRLGFGFGSYLFPTDSGYQRMVATEGRQADIPAGGVFSFPLTGFCADPTKCPPAPRENEPGLGWTMAPSLGLKFFKRPWQPSEPPSLKLEYDYTDELAPGAGMTIVEPPSLTMDEPPVQTVPQEEFKIDLRSFRFAKGGMTEIPPPTTGILDDPFIEDFLYTPFIPQIKKQLQDEGIFPKTGFSPQKEWMTGTQWHLWSKYGNFTREDSRARIEQQTQGRDIPVEKKDELNDNYWDGIDLVDKETKIQLKAKIKF